MFGCPTSDGELGVARRVTAGHLVVPLPANGAVGVDQHRPERLVTDLECAGSEIDAATQVQPVRVVDHARSRPRCVRTVAVALASQHGGTGADPVGRGPLGTRAGGDARHAVWLVACGVAVLAVVGCTSDDGDRASGAPDRSDTGNDEASGWPIDAPPDDLEVIDADLVARVVAELDIHLGDLHRAVAQEGGIGERARALSRSIYTDDAASRALDRLGGQLEVLRDDGSTPRSAIVEVAADDLDCVDALVRRDLGPVADLPEEEAIATWQVTLVVVEDSDNGTTWRMALDEPGESLPDTCS